jgi:hypothetical protein
MLSLAIVKRWLPLVFLALSACGGNTPSSDVRTSGFFVTYRVATESGQAPVATARFQVLSSDGTDLELDGGDDITCDGIGLEQTSDAGHNAYSAILPVDATSFSFVFVRPGENRDTRQVAASPALRIVATNVDGKAASALDGTYDTQFDISWSVDPAAASSGPGVITILADSAGDGCSTQTIADKISDTNTYAFDGSLFRPSDKSDPDCQYELHVMRDVSVSIGTPFAGGTLVSRAIASTSLHLHP